LRAGTTAIASRAKARAARKKPKTRSAMTKNAPEYYDIALRDFGLMLAALAFARLAMAVVPARKSGELPRRPW
jgi:hypothetical protein